MGRILMILAASCVVADDAGDDTDVPCNVEPQLDLWCYHGEPLPDSGDTAQSCPTPSGEGSEPCGAFDVVRSGGSIEGVDHFFQDGVHVATEFWSDVVFLCDTPVSPRAGVTPYWYGQVIDCP